jgi:hypothetical protein
MEERVIWSQSRWSKTVSSARRSDSGFGVFHIEPSPAHAERLIPPEVRSCGGIQDRPEDWKCRSWAFFNLGKPQHRGVQSWTSEASCLPRRFHGHHTDDSVRAQGFTRTAVNVPGRDGSQACPAPIGQLGPLRGRHASPLGQLSLHNTAQAYKSARRMARVARGNQVAHPGNG